MQILSLNIYLKKAVNINTKIKVILHDSDDPNTYEYLKDWHINRVDIPERRYMELFPNNDIEFNYSGFDKAFNEEYF